jgi:uncharacterized protein YndB with AHSA1/START domain
VTTTGAPETLILRLERTLRAPPDAVYRALTDPTLVARWLGPEGSTATVERFDARVGGDFAVRIDFPGGPSVRMTGAYQAVDPPTLLAHTWGMEGSKDPVPQVVTFRLEKAAGGTRLRLTHEGFVDREDYEQNRSGWDHLLDRIASLLAAQ